MALKIQASNELLKKNDIDNDDDDVSKTLAYNRSELKILISSVIFVDNNKCISIRLDGNMKSTTRQHKPFIAS